MTKKDYELIASAIKLANVYNAMHAIGTRNIVESTTECIARNVCQRLEEKNPRFNKEKFLKVCGVEIESHICQHNNPKACCATCKYINTYNCGKWDCRKHNGGYGLSCEER